MDDRRILKNELDEIQQQLKELEVRYEQYFAGVEKREPYQARKDLARKLRYYTNRRIVWTDMKFRYQNLVSRYASYSQYWDRILRLIDEGKYHRHTTKLNEAQQPETVDSSDPHDMNREAKRLQQQLTEARKNCGLEGEPPSAEKVETFLQAQREKIRQRYGNRAVSFSIETSDGKPRIKVSLKK